MKDNAEVKGLNLKEGDLVTLNLDENITASNVYVVHRKLDKECLLRHPLYPKCFVLRSDEELNMAGATWKNPTERCLEFIMRNKDLLDYNSTAEVEGICAYFIINRRLTPRQKKEISSLCGKIASIKLENSLSAAIRKTVENEGVLDDFNNKWYATLKGVYEGRVSPTPKQWNTVFNIAGFVLAQLERNVIPQGGANNESPSKETKA